MAAYSNVFTLHRFSEDGRTLSTITLTTSFVLEGKQWVGTCHELGASAYAKTLQEATDELRDAVVLQVNEMRKLGHEAEYLREMGVQISSLDLRSDNKNDWAAPVVAAGNA